MDSRKKTARVAGLVYLLLILFGVFAEVARSSLVVAGDAAMTVENIAASEWLFRLSFVSDLFMIISFLLLPLIFYKLLSRVGRTPALLMVIFALISVPIMFVNMIFYYALLLGTEHAILFFSLYTSGVMIATIFHGLWLFPLGYLVYKSGWFPKILGIFLMLACFGFVIESFVFFLFPSYVIVTYPGMVFEVLGEFVFMFWLLIKGARFPRKE